MFCFLRYSLIGLPGPELLANMNLRVHKHRLLSEHQIGYRTWPAGEQAMRNKLDYQNLLLCFLCFALSLGEFNKENKNVLQERPLSFCRPPY